VKAKGMCTNAISSRKYRLKEKIKNDNLSNINSTFNQFIE